ncbi:MAG TPA: hypothetical protein DCW41_07225 [Clostridiales bacterium]|nr:hypothetical protein [Clostridiales bacterium]
MLFTKITSGIITAALALAAGNSVYAADINRQNTDLIADYDDIVFTSVDGDKFTLYTEDSSIGISSSCTGQIEISVLGYDDYDVAFQGTYQTSFEEDIGSKLGTSEIYYLSMKIWVDDIDYVYNDLMIGKKDDGDIYFVKSPVYDFNVERCAELLTDDASLEECLQPQNDVECDDPYVIDVAQEITADCANDWEKSYAIYTYVTHEFAYDYAQLEDYDMVYQDDARTLLRRKIAICEGLANTYVALCRAVGVPATVSFGIGSESTDFIEDDSCLTDESPNHAWACVCLDGTWYFLDPTWDCGNSYNGDSFYTGEWEDGDSYYDYYLLPLEYFSATHKICDADTVHGLERSGSCGDNATYTIDRSGVLTISGSGEVILPYGVNGFSEVVFAEDSNITSIGEDCFVDCDILTTVILPDTVTRIEDGAFNTCEDLEYVYLPEGLTYMGDEVFDYCDELAYIYVPDSVTYIGEWAFDDCPRLIVSIPGGLDLGLSDYYIEPYKVIERGS